MSLTALIAPEKLFFGIGIATGIEPVRIALLIDPDSDPDPDDVIHGAASLSQRH
jgi:hypothetical protein